LNLQVSAYTLPWLLAEIPWVVGLVLSSGSAIYFLCSFEAVPAWRFASYLGYLFLYTLFAAFFGQTVAVLSPSSSVALVRDVR
jgi:hypothetical protein